MPSSPSLPSSVLGIPTHGMHTVVETYESLPAVRTFSFDLHGRYAALTSARRVVILPEDADIRFTSPFPCRRPRHGTG